ncbi:MAG: glutamine--fructose-6-phosphate transaminase (isomerizing), partial [Candidatus Diapherotrites archaeon]|nr:glutamine--fructose-6-phosphate transaminase (isomerizing) [Candidatus Diapherotrites archaeon]
CLLVSKKVGKISDSSDLDFDHSSLAIAHTRWATHGGVSKANAHPQLSCDGNIAVVHNGIIENYRDLKQNLLDAGHNFTSDTDTEVIVHLIEAYMKDFDFDEAVRRASLDLSGNFSFLTVKAGCDDLIAVRNGSPLVLGKADDGYFVASDASAFLEHTNKAMFLEDGVLVKVNGIVEAFKLKTGEPVEPVFQDLSWSLEQARKGDFNHFMLKEIFDQRHSMEAAINRPDSEVKEFADEIKNSCGTFFVACGTAYYAALAASYSFSEVSKEHVNVVLASEFHNYKHFLRPDTLVIAVSQSGETADVIDAVKTAKEMGSKVLSIVNAQGTTLTRLSNSCLLLNAGLEIGVASTKAYSSQVALLTLIAYACRDSLTEGRAVLRGVVKGVPDLLSAEAVSKIRSLAVRLKSSQSLFTLGRSVHFATALEAALKIKEVSYIHAEGFAGGELKHGTLALIEEGVPVISFVADDENQKAMLSNLQEVKARGGFIVGVSPEDSDVFDEWIKVPRVKAGSHLLNVIPAQLLAYYLAIERGCDPDKPRNLAKSVTVR